MLQLHKISLSPKDRAVLTSMFGNGDQIKYKEAVAQLCIDLDLAGLDEQKWTVSRREHKTAGGITTKAIQKLESTKSQTAASDQ